MSTNEDLTNDELEFCELFAASGYGAWAYKTAFDKNSKITTTLHERLAAKKLRDHRIMGQIETIRADRRAIYQSTVETCLENWLTIAMADPDELIGLRVGCCRRCHGNGFQYQWDELEYSERCQEVEKEMALCKDETLRKFIRYPDCSGGFGWDFTREPRDDCPGCRGEGIQRVVARDTSKLSPAARLLYGGVKQTKEGLQMIIADRVKALENASKIMGAFQETVNVKFNNPLVQMAVAVQIGQSDPITAGQIYEKMLSRDGS